MLGAVHLEVDGQSLFGLDGNTRVLLNSQRGLICLGIDLDFILVVVYYSGQHGTQERVGIQVVALGSKGLSLVDRAQIDGTIVHGIIDGITWICSLVEKELGSQPEVHHLNILVGIGVAVNKGKGTTAHKVIYVNI